MLGSYHSESDGSTRQSTSPSASVRGENVLSHRIPSTRRPLGMSTPMLLEEQTLNPSYTKDQPSSSSPSEHSSTEQQQPTSHPSQSEEDPSSSSSSVVIPPLPKTWLTTPTETYLPNLRKEHYAICRRTLELYPDSRICGNCMKPARQVRLKYCVECRGAT